MSIISVPEPYLAIFSVFDLVLVLRRVKVS